MGHRADIRAGLAGTLEGHHACSMHALLPLTLPWSCKQLSGTMAEPYREFAERWGNPEFMEYVKVLERQADEALAASDQVGALAAQT